MRLLVVTAFIGALVASGCASVDLAGELAKTLPAPAGQESVEAAKAIVEFERSVAEVRRTRFNTIRAQIKNGGPGPLPAEIAKQPLLQAFVSALDRASRIPTGEPAVDPGLPSPAVSAGDGKKFAIALRDAINPKTNARRTQFKAASDKSFFAFMGQYLETYADGKFVDGFGGKIGKPKFKDGFKGVGNASSWRTGFFRLHSSRTQGVIG